MSNILTASLKETLWHKMRQDLAQYVPEIAGNRLLMCCACGRLLPQECFDLEHLIPQQAVKQDPIPVKANPSTPVNVRSGNLLLCKKPLMYRGRTLYKNGCNSWKGRFYDSLISDLICGNKTNGNYIFNEHIIAAVSLCYFAMVAQFGYSVALMPSGLLMRKQFFSPKKFIPAMPLRSQILLRGDMPVSGDVPFWSCPFSFGFERDGCCTVGARNFAVMIPISRDPRETVAQHLRIVPSRYKLRPDFRTVFC